MSTDGLQMWGSADLQSTLTVPDSNCCKFEKECISSSCYNL